MCGGGELNSWGKYFSWATKSWNTERLLKEEASCPSKHWTGMSERHILAIVLPETMLPVNKNKNTFWGLAYHWKAFGMNFLASCQIFGVVKTKKSSGRKGGSGLENWGRPYKTSTPWQEECSCPPCSPPSHLSPLHLVPRPELWQNLKEVREGRIKDRRGTCH
jgi:hypothetical protein